MDNWKIWTIAANPLRRKFTFQRAISTAVFKHEIPTSLILNLDQTPLNTFKGQDNDTLKELWSENNCEIVTVPHNLTNEFQPLDISVNKAEKALIQNQYNDWFSNEVSVQLKKGIDPNDIKTTSKLSNLKPLNTSCIINFYKHLSDS